MEMRMSRIVVENGLKLAYELSVPSVEAEAFVSEFNSVARNHGDEKLRAHVASVPVETPRPRDLYQYLAAEPVAAH